MVDTLYCHFFIKKSLLFKKTNLKRDKEWIKGSCVDRGRGNSTSAETPPLFSVNSIKK